MRTEKLIRRNGQRAFFFYHDVAHFCHVLAYLLFLSRYAPKHRTSKCLTSENCLIHFESQVSNDSIISESCSDSFDIIWAGNVRKYVHLTCAPSDDSDQPAHPRSPMWIFTGRIYGWPMMQGFFMRTTKTLIRLRGCAGWFESSLGAHVSINIPIISKYRSEYLSWRCKR